MYSNYIPKNHNLSVFLYFSYAIGIVFQNNLFWPFIVILKSCINLGFLTVTSLFLSNYLIYFSEANLWFLRS